MGRRADSKWIPPGGFFERRRCTWRRRKETGERNMFLTQLLDFLSGIFYLFLHVTGSGTFPKALSAAQEKKCLEEMAQGSKAARQTLIEHNLRLVAHIVKKY